VAIGAEDTINGKRLVCIVVLQPVETGPPEDLIAQLKAYTEQKYDPLAQPDEIHVVNQIPLNLSARISQNLIRLVYEGKSPTNFGTLGNPGTLEEIRQSAGRVNHLKTP